MASSLRMWTRCDLESKNCSRAWGLSRRSFAMLLSKPLGERITLCRAQRPRDLAHLLIDVVVPGARSESVELCLEICAFLTFERRRALLETEGAVTGGAGRDRPQRASGRDQRRRSIAAPASAGGKPREVRSHIGDFLIVEGRGHALHDRVLTLAAAIVVELLVQHRGWQSGEVRKGVAWTDALSAVAPGATRR